MHHVDFIQLVQQFPAGRANGVCEANEFLVISNMNFEVRNQLRRHIQRNLGHDFVTWLPNISIRIRILQYY